ncbi:MAG: hypothetical protein Q4A05_04635 [Ruminococcus sp.]|nr:hypothetical protein [Ruminococcus sp.]
MAKEIFHTSEKSNFILNMTEEKYSKLASYGLLAALFTTSLATAIPVIVHDSMYELSAAGLAVAGVMCMILALISLMKKYIRGKVVFPICAFAAMLLWGVVSLINSYDVGISFYGYNGRGEGLLALIFYLCFFITGASIKREKVLKTVVYGLAGLGLLNSAFGLIQVFTGKISNYRMISIEVQANAASGLSQSPLFLAMVLTLVITSSLIAAVSVKGKASKVFFIVTACICSFTMMFTYSLIGICGAVFAVIAAIAAVFALRVSKAGLLSVLAVIVPAAAAVGLVQAGLIGNLSQYRLYDGRILWFADSYYRISASGEPDLKNIDLDDTYEVYYKLNSKTMNIISLNKLTGTGPEQLVFPQLYTYGDSGADENSPINEVVIANKGTFDKVYNEYLYTAATRGIPSLIALVLVLVPVLFIGAKRTKKGTWVQVCMFILSLGGVLIFFIGCSNTAFSPIFWAVAGCSIAQIAAPAKAAAVPAGEAPAKEEAPEKAAEPAPEKEEAAPVKADSAAPAKKPQPKKKGGSKKKK